jgi:hypothetical protein
MTRSISTALILGLFAVFIAQSAVAENAGTTTPVSQLGESEQFGTIKVTLESFAIQGVNADRRRGKGDLVPSFYRRAFGDRRARRL